MQIIGIKHVSLGDGEKLGSGRAGGTGLKFGQPFWHSFLSDSSVRQVYTTGPEKFQ